MTTDTEHLRELSEGLSRRARQALLQYDRPAMVYGRGEPSRLASDFKASFVTRGLMTKASSWDNYGSPMFLYRLTPLGFAVRAQLAGEPK